MVSDPKILERLSKLLEMSERGTEHEAQVAGERAAELMAKHQIAMADVTAFIVGQSVVAVETGRVDAEDKAPMGKRSELWMEVLLVGVVQGLGGRAWKQAARKVYMFWMVGPPDTVSAARYLYMALSRDISRLSRKEMRDRGETNSWRRAYARGMSMRVSERIRVGRQNVMSTAGTALVHVSRQQAAVEEAVAALNMKESRGGGTKTPDAIGEGYRDGATLDISDTGRTQIGEGKKQLPE